MRRFLYYYLFIIIYYSCAKRRSALFVFVTLCIATRLVCLSAIGTTLGFVSETFFRIKFLLACGKDEFFSAILTGQCLVDHQPEIISFIDSTFRTADEKRRSISERAVIKLVL